MAIVTWHCRVPEYRGQNASARCSSDSAHWGTIPLKYLVLGLSLLFLGGLPDAGAASEAARSPTLEKIRAQGVITVGVKTDFAPFGFLSQDGKTQGFEVDLARRIGAEIGVRVETAGVSTANRFQRLEQGAIQLVIATAADTRERRKIATAIEPGYFGAGVNVLLRPETDVKDWADLRGLKICALQAAYFNKGITSRYVIDLQTYKSIANAQAALMQGECAGFLYSETAIQAYLKKPEFAGYKANLEAALIVPWAAFISRDEKGTEFELLLGDIIAGLHREGYLIGLQEKWGLAPSSYLTTAQARWSATDIAGTLVCQRIGSGEWNVDCRDKAFITSADVEGVSSLFKRIEEVFGLNFSFVYDKFDRDRYVKGILVSLEIIVISTILALVLGFILAKCLFVRSAMLNALARGFVFAVGTVPPLLAMYLVFFGLGAALVANYGIHLPALVVAIGSLGLYHGAIIANTIRDSIGLRSGGPEGVSLRVSDLPAILKTASVGINGAITNLVKASMIASAIAVPELLSATIGIFSDQGNTNVMMILLFIVFIFITTTWMAIVRKCQALVVDWAGGR
jgi:polar amino acid transport system substrate-binding protein